GPSVLAPRLAWRLWQGASPCRGRASHPPVASLASMAGSRWYTRRIRWAKCRQRILEATRVTAPPEVLVQLRQGFADAEGVNAPEGHTYTAVRAGRWRSRQSPRAVAGREASKHVEGSLRSCAWKPRRKVYSY